MRVLSGVASGLTMDANLSDKAAADLRIAGADSQTRPQAIDAMLHANALYSDGYRLLETMGTVAGKGDTVSEAVREAIKAGLGDQKSHKSAVNGLYGYVDKWTKIDSENVLKFSSPEMISGLNKNADKIPAALREAILEQATATILSRQKADGKDASEVALKEKMAALKTIGAMGKYASADQVRAVAQFGESEGQRLTDPPLQRCARRQGLDLHGL